MAHRAGLHQVKKSVRTKSGKTVQRSYWVKGADAAKAAGGKIKGAARAAGGFLNRHKGKIAAGVGLAAAAYGAHKGRQFVKGYKGMGMSHSDAAKAILGGLKARAKGAAESGAHAVVGVGARAHKAASTAAQAVSARVKQGMRRSAASGVETNTSRMDRAKAAVGRAGQHVRSVAAGVVAKAKRTGKSKRQIGS